MEKLDVTSTIITKVTPASSDCLSKRLFFCKMSFNPPKEKPLVRKVTSSSLKCPCIWRKLGKKIKMLLQ